MFQASILSGLTSDSKQKENSQSELKSHLQTDNTSNTAKQIYNNNRLANPKYSLKFSVLVKAPKVPYDWIFFILFYFSF